MRKHSGKRRLYIVPLGESVELLVRAASQPRAMKAAMLVLGGKVRLASQEDIVRLVSAGVEPIDEPDDPQMELDVEVNQRPQQVEAANA